MRLREVFALLLTAVLITDAKAQQAGVRIGGVTAYPTVGLGLGHDDNVALEAGSDREESLFYMLAPGVRLERGGRRSALRLELAAELGEYLSTSQDDYLDYGASLEWLYDPTVRHTLGSAASYQRGHFRRGDGLQGFIRPDPTARRDVDQFRRRDLDVSYRYGAEGARGRLDLSVAWGDLRYLNNRDLTAIADFERQQVGAAFGWRVASRTSLLAIARVAATHYDLDTRDNTARFLGMGVEWSATAKTSGRIEAGHRQADYEGDGLDFSGASWLASVEWRPRERALLEFSTGRTTDSAFGASTFVVRESYEFTWRHQWRPRLGSVVDLGRADESLEPGTREDEVTSLGVAMNLELRRGVQLGVAYRHFDRNSTDPGFTFEQNEVLLSAELAF